MRARTALRSWALLHRVLPSALMQSLSGAGAEHQPGAVRSRLEARQREARALERLVTQHGPAIFSRWLAGIGSQGGLSRRLGCWRSRIARLQPSGAGFEVGSEVERCSEGSHIGVPRTVERALFEQT